MPPILRRFFYGNNRKRFIFPTAITIAGQLAAQAYAGISPNVPQKLNDGIVVSVGGNFLKLEVCADDVIRVAYAKDRAFFARKSLMAGLRKDAKIKWSLKTENGGVILTTDKLQAHVDLASGAVSFFDSGGRPILAEKKEG
ncbi:MAG TPA: DUF4968 domain-containing protein, partial [Phycisphaerae bacterium]|nr:DUF4968 domain-containing protein [Phycisphaerae bacterium]